MTIKQHEIAVMDLRVLNPAPYNPRVIGSQAMGALGVSLDTFGVLQPLVWNKRTGNLVGGHQRLRVLQDRGVKQAQVVVVDLDEALEKAANIALNSEHLTGEFTYSVDQVLRDISEDLGDVFEGLRFDDLLEPEWESLIEDFDPDNPTGKFEIIVFEGDVWITGYKAIVCSGDKPDDLPDDVEVVVLAPDPKRARAELKATLMRARPDLACLWPSGDLYESVMRAREAEND